MFCMWTQEHFKELPLACLDHIKLAMESSYGERELKHVAQELAKGSKQIWLKTLDEKFIATVITHVIDYPNKRTCEICYLGGESGEGVMDSLKDIQEIENWATLNNCDDIQVFGRRGWLRPLKEHGFSERYTILGKSLKNPSDNKGLLNDKT